MRDVFVRALYNRIKSGQMTAEQIPEPYKTEIETILLEENENERDSN